MCRNIPSFHAAAVVFSSPNNPMLSRSATLLSMSSQPAWFSIANRLNSMSSWAISVNLKKTINKNLIIFTSKLNSILVKYMKVILTFRSSRISRTRPRASVLQMTWFLPEIWGQKRHCTPESLRRVISIHGILYFPPPGDRAHRSYSILFR